MFWTIFGPSLVKLYFLIVNCIEFELPPSLKPIADDEELLEEENDENASPSKKEIKLEADDLIEAGAGDDDPTDADYGKTALHLTVRKSGRR